MFENYQICPYTGLRSFTEEESLYFKGREEHIEQATEQLQRNKFLMLTGASGDGKSSLVYAGIVPNARSGFLKSKYTQWSVADFRPERSPFKNLCRALAKQLDITNIGIVESELQHGFSALVDLYKNSKCYIDVDSMVWQQADESQRAVLKRKASNLIIIVDQFEEFFTNPENYHHGMVSRDSNLVLNILLETARIALEEGLPIYIVFTMRSDYIGQCAAFRSLPEYIGFSQFFVPRLNRSQLQQVIEEPAMLSGNRISRRLTERLIHDVAEGVDQLPILQHALSQIWHAADMGLVEMDLIHYAMVGGMSVNELPDEQVAQFKIWFEGLTPVIKACYDKPDLQNVLDTHTNKLYEHAGEYYTQKTGKFISEAEAKAIIKVVFVGLTKIDESRAVRNRMTLKEITNILGKPRFDSNEVGKLLNIFREPGNTFIRPFMLEDDTSKELKDTDVLDITHESLIRNWEYLETWANEEFRNYTISLDFEQQLNRWVESGKSNGFLLSIGALTYFENWYQKVNPNAYWIARYLPDEIETEKKLATARQVITNAQEFLQRSASKHVVTRTFIRYGARRIGVTLSVLMILVMSSFGIKNYLAKQNDAVFKSIKAQTLKIANKEKQTPEFPIPPITELLMANQLTIPEVIAGIDEPYQKIRIVTGIATMLVMQGNSEPEDEIVLSLRLADSLLNRIEAPGTGKKLIDELILINDYSVTVGLAYFFNPDSHIESMMKRNAARSARWASYILSEQPEGFTNIQFLHLALENAINNKIYSEDEVHTLLSKLSPFENVGGSNWLTVNYSRDKVLVRGTQTYGVRYNGLFQELAYLYAAVGKTDKVLQCVDSILKYNSNFYNSDYATHIENATNIAGVYFTYGKQDKLDSFVIGYTTKSKTDPVDFYGRLVARMFIDLDVIQHANFYGAEGGQEYSNLNLKFSSDRMLSFFYKKLKDAIMKLSSADERNFRLAVAHKNEGNMKAYRHEIRSLTSTEDEVNVIYSKAVSYYQSVSASYLKEAISIVANGNDFLRVPRKHLFIYPDYRVPFHPFEPRSIIQFYNSPSFIQYVISHQLVDEFYPTENDLKLFELWLLDYNILQTSRNWFLHDRMKTEIMDNIVLAVSKRSKEVDLNILLLHLADAKFNANEPDSAIHYLEMLRTEKLLNAFQYKNFGFANTYSLEMVARAIANLIQHHRIDLAYRFINVFRKEVNRSSLYGYASQLISLSGKSSAMAEQLIDSAKMEMNRIKSAADFQPNRLNVAIALMYLNPVEHAEEANKIIKNSFNKFSALTRFSLAHSFYGALYEATTEIPALISTSDQADFLFYIVNGYNLSLETKPEWKRFRDNEFLFSRGFLPYINENQ